MNQEVIKIPSAKLRLTAMTLRGIGPYKKGARLELRPLTILCGTNGSGKSTWIKALRALQNALDDKWFPLRLSSARSFFYGAAQEKQLPNKAVPEDDNVADESFGSFGSLGLEIEVLDDCRLPQDKIISLSDIAHTSNALERFFFDGKLKKGDEILLRVGDAFGVEWVTSECAFPKPLSSFWLNGSLVGRVVLHREDSESAGKRALRCEVELSSIIANVQDADSDQVAVASLPLTTEAVPSLHPINPPDGDMLGQRLFDLMGALCGELMRGFFPLGSIREEQKSVMDAATVAARYVGFRGQYVPRQRELFYNNEILYTGPKEIRSNYFPFMVNGAAILSAIEEGAKFPVENWREILRTYAAEGLDLLNRIRSCDSFEAAENDPLIVWRLSEADSERLISETLRGTRRADVPFRDLNYELNGIASKVLQSLFMASLRDKWSRELALARAPRLVLPEGLSLSAIAEYQTHKALYRLIGETFAERQPIFIETRDTPSKASFLNQPVFPVDPDYYRGPLQIGHLFHGWMKHLLGYHPAEPLYDDYELEESDVTGIMLADSPTGHLPPPDSPLDYAWSTPQNRDISDFSALSTGFHQIAPIVLQSLLMKPYEIFSVENPEVHLHPRLQVKITEYLLKEAAEQKIILIETHSDLVVRRVIRAILEEELSQKFIRIYFSKIEYAEPRNDWDEGASQIECIQVDRKGRIENWPDGFMDEDIKESRRLLDIMYSDPEDSEE